jgi:cysteine desulfurase/selenocysteine lyase
MSNLNLKSDFPIFQTYPGLIYLDTAATSQKPQSVIDTVTNFYTRQNANIHRSAYHLAELATQTYENTRTQISKFINARSTNEIIFTNNTNHAINIISYGWARKFLQSGDIIVLSEMEHHANIVPWLRLKEEKGIKLIFLPLTKDYRLDYTSLRGADTKATKQSPIDPSKIKLLSLTHASNVLGTINPLDEIIPHFKKLNPQTKILIDAAQSIPHLPINVQKLNIDFLAFSSHKMLGPSGVGVLWAKEKLLSEMDPLLTGSHMISTVTKQKATYAALPDKFETGTANLEGVAGLGSAIAYLQKIGIEKIISHEQQLTQYALAKLTQLPYLQIYGPATPQNRLAIFSFGIKGIHPHDISQILDHQNIAVRAGHHCAQITMQALGVPAATRASLYLYNTKQDIDKLITGLELVKKTLKIND